jgi:predicted AlkP superfamily pyrophosphatase or phosphodiesterase
MFKMLPTSRSDVVSLADVLPTCLASLGWEPPNRSFSLPAARTTVLILVDGLGAQNLDNARGYARFLSRAQVDSQLAQTIFPSTTATALSTLVTGTYPQSHGILGYRILDPEIGSIVNQLNGLTSKHIDSGWLRSTSLLHKHASAGRQVTVVGHPRFEDSMLTQLLYGASKYVGVRDFEQRFDAVLDRINTGEEGFFFIYISDLDEAAHSHGAASPLWLERAELLDGALAGFVSRLPAEVNVTLTADHGIVDVPNERHLNYSNDLLDGVWEVGGEPRCIQLHLDDEADPDEVKRAWLDWFGPLVSVQKRGEVFALNPDSAADIEVLNRAGDVFIFPADGYALYPEDDPRLTGRNMVGQHGGRSDAEILIPLISWRAGVQI